MEIKHWLYFGLGTLATIPFGLRSIVQWFLSEYHRRSHVTLSFWVFSIMGNILMLIHYLIQVQFHLYFIRIFPLYLTFRQVMIIKEKAHPFSWSRLCKHLTLIICCLTLLFVIRVWLEYRNFFWIFSPQMPWEKTMKSVSSFWHLLGFVGAGLFMRRMWVQWWQSEKAKESVLTPSFWWISLIGASLTLCYAIYIRDIVTALGYGLGLIPYIRNLMLIKKENQAQEVL